MKSKLMLSLGVMGLVGLMATPVFANEGAGSQYGFAWGGSNQSTLQMTAEKANVAYEDLLTEKESGVDCGTLMDSYGLDKEEVFKAKLDGRLEAIDRKVADGKITEEEGLLIKEKIQDHGFLMNGKGPHKGEGQGMNLQMQNMRNQGGRGLKAQR